MNKQTCRGTTCHFNLSWLLLHYHNLPHTSKSFSPSSEHNLPETAERPKQSCDCDPAFQNPLHHVSQHSFKSPQSFHWGNMEGFWQLVAKATIHVFVLLAYFSLDRVQSTWLGCLWTVDEKAVYYFPEATLKKCCYVNSKRSFKGSQGQIHTAICLIKRYYVTKARCPFMLVDVCLTWMSINNGHDKIANLMSFTALTQDNVLPGMCGKASFTPELNIATEEHTSVWIYEWISEWTGNKVWQV